MIVSIMKLFTIAIAATFLIGIVTGAIYLKPLPLDNGQQKAVTAVTNSSANASNAEVECWIDAWEVRRLVKEECPPPRRWAHMQRWLGLLRDNAMNILITGSRHYSNKKLMTDTLDKLRPIELIIHGAARGADMIAQEYAENHSIATCQHPANWKKYGRRAGPIRNQAMLYSHPDINLVLAFPLSDSIGTWDMVRKAHAHNIPVQLINEELQGYAR